MIDLVLDACRLAGIEDVTAVISPAQPAVRAHLEGRCALVHQEEPLGSGHALAQVPAEKLGGTRAVLVLNGDAPLVRAESVGRVVEAHLRSGGPATLTSVDDASRPDGRIVRQPDGSLERIVEYKDASEEERGITEINVGLYCFNGPELVGALSKLRPDNAAGELYLTDLFRHLRPAQVVRLEDPEEALGINDRVQLARAEAALRRRLLVRLMLSGVTVVDPDSTFVDVEVEVGQDTVLEPFTVLRGRTRIGRDCRIGPFVEIRDADVGDGSDCGPFSKLRPGTTIAEEVHIGSFAEVVRSRIGRGSKVPHVSYLGDATVGEGVNIGAGSITANFDGRQKNPTVIEDGAFIGVDTMLRAPVRVGRGARTGAGAVVTRDVPPGKTAVGMPARILEPKEEPSPLSPTRPRERGGRKEESSPLSPTRPREGGGKNKPLPRDGGGKMEEP
jgi:bifunctional UDP-N-acetylglucosamine pyrophosphorylase/glucosamine-1-phosphate N-acetyltransferase